MPKALLPSIPPLNVPYRKQVQHADCLAACAAMILDYYEIVVPYSRLLNWTGISNHTITIIGLVSDTVIALDPAFEASPFYISRGDFELAWGNADYACAIIMPEQQE